MRAGKSDSKLEEERSQIEREEKGKSTISVASIQNYVCADV
jgi:hypothetical protein